VNQSPFEFAEQAFAEQNLYDQYEQPAYEQPVYEQPAAQPPAYYQPDYQTMAMGQNLAMGQYHGSVALPLGREHDNFSDVAAARASSDYGGNYQNQYSGSCQLPLAQAGGDYAYTGSLDGDGGGYDGGGFENGYAAGFHDAQNAMNPTPVYAPAAHVSLGPPTLIGVGQPVVHSVSLTTRVPSPHRMRTMSPVREASPVRMREASPVRGGSLVVTAATPHGRHRSPSPVRGTSRGSLTPMAPQLAIPQTTLMPSTSFVPVTNLPSSGSFVAPAGMFKTGSFVPTPAPVRRKDDEDSASSDDEKNDKPQGLLSKMFNR